MWSTRVLVKTQEVLSLGAGAVFHHVPMARSGFLGLVDYRFTRFTQVEGQKWMKQKTCDEQWRIYLKAIWLFIFYMLCKLAEDDLVCLEICAQVMTLSDPTQCKCSRIRKSSKFHQEIAAWCRSVRVNRWLLGSTTPPRMQSSPPGWHELFLGR